MGELKGFFLTIVVYSVKYWPARPSPKLLSQFMRVKWTWEVRSEIGLMVSDFEG
jgi:hypothetical protein